MDGLRAVLCKSNTTWTPSLRFRVNRAPRQRKALSGFVMMNRSLKSVATRLLRRADGLFARWRLALGEETPGIVALGFHGIVSGSGREAARLRLPQERVSEDLFRTLIDHFLESGHRFVTDNDILAGLDPSGRYVWITFDDGYACHGPGMDILREYGLKGTLFPVVANVVSGRAFWWDVLYRGRLEQGKGLLDIAREIAALLPERPQAVEKRLEGLFGTNCLHPLGDEDRPYTEQELRDLADSGVVTIGNHTFSHADLSALDGAGALAEIGSAQAELTRIVGHAPRSLAFPMGRHGSAARDAAARSGLRLAVSVEPRRNPVRATDNAAPRILGRFLPAGEEDPGAACMRFRAGCDTKRLLSLALRRVGH